MPLPPFSSAIDTDWRDDAHHARTLAATDGEVRTDEEPAPEVHPLSHP
ncbi:hypothetical protein IPZ58_05350 [Streptomyces roseoverticillatus]|nr:hypothetical protein [Streptomyces roseoverticillatus]MCF3101001.1 hypothetical protein [Streptomyces roseoverticillatus]